MSMKYLLISLLILFTTPFAVYAQGFAGNPALDSNCYFPSLSNHNEIDSIYGSHANQGLGSLIHNTGLNQGGNVGSVLIGSDGPFNSLAEPTEIIERASTGPSFDLHKLKATAQKFLPDIDNLRFGHFHNRSNVDIFDAHNWIIYWADDQGNYDSTRKTQLKTRVLGDDYPGRLDDGGTTFTPYLTHLTSDTVDDIVLGYYTIFSDRSKDSLFAVLYRGGSQLGQSSIAYEDTSAKIGAVQRFVANSHIGIQGDFRGTGREDLLIVDDAHNFFFFRNDPPFRLADLARAIVHDTLLVRAENVHMRDSAAEWPDTHQQSVIMHALPKKLGDKSVDWVVPIWTDDDRDNGLFFFRGGPDFGSHRITIDSAAFVIRHPRNLSPNFSHGYYWPGEMHSAGDLTGTGNQVLYVLGSTDARAYLGFYVTGRALDEKMDAYIPFDAGAIADTMTGNQDSLEDFLMGFPGYSSDEDLANNKYVVGSVWLLYGARSIPVRINPQFSGVKPIEQLNGIGISLFPNPARTWSVATIVWPVAERAEYKVYNLLGSLVVHGTIQLLGGAEEQRIDFPGLASGVYQLVIVSASHEGRTRLVIAR